MAPTHLVEFRRGTLQPLCGALRADSSWTARQDDLVTCVLCQLVVRELLRDAAEGVELSMNRARDAGWEIRAGVC